MPPLLGLSLDCDRPFLDGKKWEYSLAAIVCDTTGNTVRQGYCCTCLAIGRGVSVGSLRAQQAPQDKLKNGCRRAWAVARGCQSKAPTCRQENWQTPPCIWECYCGWVSLDPKSASDFESRPANNFNSQGGSDSNHCDVSTLFRKRFAVATLPITCKSLPWVTCNKVGVIWHECSCPNQPS